MNRDLVDLFDALSDGLVLVGSGGQVLYANRAARHRFGAVRDDKLDPAISETLLRWRSLGYVSAASSVSLPVSSSQQAHERMLVSVFEAGVAGQTALLIRSMNAGSGHGNIGQLLLESMAAEARAALRAGAGSLDLAARSLHSLPELGEAGAQVLAWHCELGSGRMSAFAQELEARVRSGRDSLEAEADIAVLGTALKDAMQSVRPLCEQRSVTLTGGAADTRELVVQGSGFLIRWAFRDLLRHVVWAAGRGSRIQVGVRAGSSEIVVRVVTLPPVAAQQPGPRRAPAHRGSAGSGSGSGLGSAGSGLGRDAAGSAGPGPGKDAPGSAGEGGGDAGAIGLGGLGGLGGAGDSPAAGCTASDEIAGRLFGALGGSLTRVSTARGGSTAFVVRLPRQPDPMGDYFDAYAQIEREAGVLADLVIRRVAAAASRT